MLHNKYVNEASVYTEKKGVWLWLEEDKADTKSREEEFCMLHLRLN